MSTPVIQFFGTSGTWSKPAGAVRVDIVLQGGQAGAVTGALMPTTGPPGGFTGAHLGTLINPDGYVVSNGEPGEIRASSFDAADLPETVEVTVGKGGRPGGRDGYALLVTHLDGSTAPHAPGRVYTRGKDGTGPRDPICLSCGRPMSQHDAEQEAER